MFQYLFRLLAGKPLLLLAVDTSDKDDIQRHIALLQHIQSGVQTAHKLPFAKLLSDKPLVLRLKSSEGRIETVSRTEHPKLIEVLDYLHDNTNAEYMSVRRLATRISGSKSLVHQAKQYWTSPENREAFAAFREQEEAGTPF